MNISFEKIVNELVYERDVLYVAKDSNNKEILISYNPNRVTIISDGKIRQYNKTVTFVSYLKLIKLEIIGKVVDLNIKYEELK